MSFIRRIASLVRRSFNLRRRDRLDADIEAELQSHIDLRTEAHIAAGLSSAEAGRAARLSLGNPVVLRERTLAADAALGLESATRDLRYALRQMRKAPGFSLTIVLTLTIGIAATTTIFSVVYATLLGSLPYPQADRILAIHDTRAEGQSTGGLVSVPRFFDLRTRNRSLIAMGFFFFSHPTLIAGNQPPVAVRAVGANAGFWDVFATTPLLGRTFTPADDARAAPETIVLSYDAWQRLFNGDPAVINRQVTLEQKFATIIGVMPESFRMPGRIDLWHPAHYDPADWAGYRGDGVRFINVYARPRPGVTAAAARADLARISQQLQREHPASDAVWQFSSNSLRDNRFGSVKPALLILLIASGLLLLIACINVANLLLSRATARQREVALRRALGATGRRIAAQYLTESTLLALIGGALGVVCAVVVIHAAAAKLPGPLGGAGAIHVNWPVLAFAFLISAATGMIFGMAPVLEARRLQLNAALKQGDVRLSGAAGNTLRNALISIQVALSLVLLVGASLLGESLWRLIRNPLGFVPEHLLTFSIDLPWNSKQDAIHAFYSNVQQRIESLPGVNAVGQTDALPTVDWHLRDNFDADWLPRVAGQPALNVEVRSMAGNFLSAMGTPLLAGRPFAEQDAHAKLAPLLVNQDLARRYPGRSIVGHHLLVGNQSHEVIGVIADLRGTSGSLTAAPGPVVYWPADASGGGSHRYFVVKTEVAPEQLVPIIREQVRAADPNEAIADVGTMDQLLGEATAQPRLNMAVIAAFAGIALLLACVGIYGVVAWFVAQRTQEIGVRMALGANRAQITQLFLGRALIAAGLGIVAGLAAALALAQLLRSELYGVTPYDPRIYAASVLGLLVPVLLASLRPALRAASVNPVRALRAD